MTWGRHFYRIVQCLCVRACVCVCVCVRARARVCVNCFSSNTDGVFLVRPLPVSFAIKCYSLGSQSRIAVIDDNVKYILCPIIFFPFCPFDFLDMRMERTCRPDVLSYARGVCHVCGKGPQPLLLVASLAARVKIRKKWYT